MPLYEHVFIARQDISTAQAEGLTEEFSTILTEHGATILKTESWGLKSLMYRIKKNRKGHYVLLGVDAPPAAMAELERQQRIHEDVLRYMTVKVDEIDPDTPSPILSKREERRRRDRDDRGGDRGDRGDRGERSERPPREPRAEASAD